MNELLQQLGELALGAIPTLILFITLVLAYRYILYGRLMETRAEREKRTSGALEKSRQAIGQADVRSQEYEAKLRAARAEIFRRREQRIQQMERRAGSRSGRGSPGGSAARPGRTGGSASAERRCPPADRGFRQPVGDSGSGRGSSPGGCGEFAVKTLTRCLSAVLFAALLSGPAAQLHAQAARQLFVFAARKALGRGRRAHGRAGDQL